MNGKSGVAAFKLLILGQLISLFGTGLSSFGLSVWVYQEQGSVTRFAMVLLAGILPGLLVAPWAGALVDRWDRRLTIVTIEVVRAVAFFAAGIAYAIDYSFLSVEVFYALFFLESSLQNFFNPARLALVPNLVKQDDLRAANSLMEVSRHIGFLVAPPAGVALASVFGSSTILLADGATFLISGITVFMIRWRQPRRVLERVVGWSRRLRRTWRRSCGRRSDTPTRWPTSRGRRSTKRRFGRMRSKCPCR